MKRKLSNLLIICLMGSLISSCNLSMIPSISTGDLNSSSSSDESFSDKQDSTFESSTLISESDSESSMSLLEQQQREIYDLYVESGGRLSFEIWLSIIKGEKGDKGDQGEPGIDGNDGSDGKDGQDGVAGKDGQDGKSTYTGNGQPTSFLGNDGDSYIDMSTWNLYEKVVGSWILKANLNIKEDQPNEDVPEINEKVRVSLERNVYVLGETLDVKKVEVWSSLFNAFVEKTNYSIKMPTQVNNGLAYAKVSIGTYETYVKIYYYENESIATSEYEVAFPSNPVDYFDEADYIHFTDKKLKFTAIERDGEVFSGKTQISLSKLNTPSKDPQYNANLLDGFDGTKNQIYSIYDETKLTIPHLVLDGKDYYCTTYTPPYTDGSIVYDNNYMYEIITDAEGHIVYLAPIYHDPEQFINVATGIGYWSIYKNYIANPCFVFAEDYNPNTNPYAYQKVLPEGGQWFVGTTNDTHKPGKIDGIFSAATGLNIFFYTAKYENLITLTWNDQNVEAKLNETIVKYETVGTRRLVNVYQEADIYQKYTYHYLDAMIDNNSQKLYYRSTVYNLLTLLKTPQVANEPIIYNHYYKLANEALEVFMNL